MEFIGLAIMSLVYIFLMAFIGIFIVVIGLGMLNLVVVVFPRWLKSLSEPPKKESSL